VQKQTNSFDNTKKNPTLISSPQENKSPEVITIQQKLRITIQENIESSNSSESGGKRVMQKKAWRRERTEKKKTYPDTYFFCDF